MKKVTKFGIIRVEMEGFKKFKEPYSVKLDKLTYISGGNGQGKTTIADAIAFAFCGTPFWGEKSSDRLQNAECTQMRVALDFVDQDGEVHNLIRRRSGNNMSITMDKIQLRQVDLTEMFAEKDIFLSILNPLYFIEKIAEDGRELLQKLLPVIDEKVILSQLSDSTRTLLENESIYEPEVYIKNRRAEIKDMDENVTYFEGQIDLLNKQRKEAAEKVDEVVARGQKILDRKELLENKQFDGIDIDALKAKQAEISKNIDNDKKAILLSKKAEIENREYKSKYAEQLASLKTQIGNLSTQCKNLKAQAEKIKIGDVCPTCRTAVTESNYKSIIGGIKKRYDEAYTLGKDAMQTYREISEFSEKDCLKFTEFKRDDLRRVEKELNSLETHSILEIAELDDKIKFGNLSEKEFEELENLKKQADAYTAEVNALCETDKAPEKIAEIQKQIKAITDKKKETQNLIHAVGEFAAKKAELTLNQLKMNHASIKLFEVVKTTGELKNTFKFTYDGKDYSQISTSEKVKAGLEVAKLLTRLTGLVYPIYIDNAECITTGLESVQGQLIAALARKTELAVFCPGRNAARTKEAA